MTKIIVDRELRSKLGGLTEALELCDEDGHVLAHVELVSEPMTDQSDSYSDEELTVISQRTAGRPLREFWQDLKGR